MIRLTISFLGRYYFWSVTGSIRVNTSQIYTCRTNYHINLSSTQIDKNAYIDILKLPLDSMGAISRNSLEPLLKSNINK